MDGWRERERGRRRGMREERAAQRDGDGEYSSY